MILFACGGYLFKRSNVPGEAIEEYDFPSSRDF